MQEQRPWLELCLVMDASLCGNLEARGLLKELLGSAFEVFWLVAFFEPPGRKNGPGGAKPFILYKLTP